MTLNEVKIYYKTSYNFESCTGMSRTNFNNWDARGYIPMFTQRRLERMTNGELKADANDTRSD